MKRQVLVQCGRLMLMLALPIASIVIASHASAETIFESGTLGPTGLAQGSVTATNVNPFVYPGVRFQLTKPVITSQIGGHFVSRTNGIFFGEIVELDNASDFPNSVDLSTPDVLGTATLAFSALSAEVFGNLSLSLDPGWYALVFGSGLFETNGDGAAVRNGVDIGDPSYIAFDPNLDWFNLEIFGTTFDNHRFVVHGMIVPEPTGFALIAIMLTSVLWFHIRSRQ